jgi:hypothetical protein
MKSIKFFLAITALTVLIGSCDKIKDFGDTNVNPGVTATPSTAALLTSAIAGLGGFAANTTGALYAQHISETQYTEVSLYALPKADFDGIYAASLYDLQNIININTDAASKGSVTKFGSNNNQIAVARILKAYIFWTITDRWGDIPYFEALKGNENLTPKYDKQEDIYKDLIKELTEAKGMFETTGAPPLGDIMFHKPGTPTTTTTVAWATAAGRWKKLANSLRMLIALRTSKVYPNVGEWAATAFAAAFNDADGYISVNTDNFVLNYAGNVAAFRHPWFNLYNGRTDYAESKVITDYMAAYSDPRQAAYGSNLNGFPYGLTRDQAIALPTNYAKVLADNKRTTTSPIVLVGAAHVSLAIAEAAQRGWITANAVTWYQNGITASWGQWGVTGTIATYYANPNVDLATGNALQKIQFQQYLAYFPDGIQAWANWRRTGVPALVPTVNATNTSKQIPRRFVYGNREYSLNTANVTAAAALYNNDSPDGRVWWDKP